jgi:hypothetical protein
MNDQWSDSLRRRIEAHEETRGGVRDEAPFLGLWDDIERAMDLRQRALRNRRRAMVWSVCTVAAASLLLFVFLPLADPGGDLPAGEGMAGVTREPVPQGSVAQEPIRREVLPPESLSSATPTPSPTSATTRIPVSTPGPASTSGLAYTSGAVPASEPSAQDEEVRSETTSGTGPKTTPEPTPETAPGRRRYDWRDFPGEEVSRPKESRWQASVFAANMSSSNDSGSYDFYQLSSSTSNIGSGEYYDFATGAPIREPVYTDVVHRLPVTVGVSVSYGLDERWSITGGVGYTMLSSRFRAGGRAGYHSREQVLHNVGILLGVRREVWRTGGVSIYALAGGGVEKSVAGSATFRYVSGDGILPDQRRKLSDRAQFSINGSLGVQYDFARGTGLYAEPGVNYYFDNESAIETIYKAKPLNLGLRLGIRFSL